MPVSKECFFVSGIKMTVISAMMLVLLAVFLGLGELPVTKAQDQKIPLNVVGLDSLDKSNRVASIHIPSYCDSSERYRSIDGSCNNLRYVNWGMLGRPFRRFLKQEYDDGISKPCVYRNNKKILPSSRLVSTNCHPDDHDSAGEGRDPNLSMLFMQWGQFVDHDITATAEDEEPEDCCEKMKPDGTHPHYDEGGACFPILIPANDHEFKRKCMNFIRSKANKKTEGVKHRQQMNMITSYLDASHIYGSSNEEIQDLRAYKLGLLRTSPSKQLPRGINIQRPCMNETGAPYCLNSGDVRVNEQPGLTCLHTLLHKLHNYIARSLKSLNPHWNDEHIFQESRKINGAVMQHITYKHWLPIVLGPGGMRWSKISWSYRYQQDLSPEIFNSFATAAFRFGHSLVPRELRTASSNRTLYNSLYFRPFFLSENNHKGLYTIMEGMASDSCNRYDRFMTNAVTDHLFETVVEPMDLAARNIQRSRDHGLAPYYKYSNLARSYRPRVHLSRDCLKSYDYKFDNVDLFVGGLTEKPYNGGMVGPTFAYIIGKQFYNIKNGDRFWYENQSYNTRFTRAQLRAIKKITLSRVMCDVLQFGKMQLDAFRKESFSNPKVSCSNQRIPYLDFSAWKE